MRSAMLPEAVPVLFLSSLGVVSVSGSLEGLVLLLPILSFTLLFSSNSVVPKRWVGAHRRDVAGCFRVATYQDWILSRNMDLVQATLWVTENSKNLQVGEIKCGIQCSTFSSLLELEEYKQKVVSSVQIYSLLFQLNLLVFMVSLCSGLLIWSCLGLFLVLEIPLAGHQEAFSSPLQYPVGFKQILQCQHQRVILSQRYALSQ